MIENKTRQKVEEFNLAQLPPVTRLFGFGHFRSLIAPEFQLTQRRSSWSVHQAYDILTRAVKDVIRDQGDFARQGCSGLNLDGLGILSWVLVPLFGRGKGEGNERDLHGEGDDRCCFCGTLCGLLSPRGLLRVESRARDRNRCSLVILRYAMYEMATELLNMTKLMGGSMTSSDRTTIRRSVDPPAFRC